MNGKISNKQKFSRLEGLSRDINRGTRDHF